MQNHLLKGAFAVLIVLMAAVFIWKPLSLPFSKSNINNDFVLQTVDGQLDSKSLRGKVLAAVFAYTDCPEACAAPLVKLAKAYALLNERERTSVQLVLISADPERDTPARIKEYAARFHPDIIAATGKPQEIQAVAEGFAAQIQKSSTTDGGQVINLNPFIYIVDAEGRFSSVLNENISPESVAQSLRSKIPPHLPPVN